MSLLRSYDVRCDECHDFLDDPYGYAEDVRRAARTSGWHRTRDGRDICPDCWEEGKR